MKLLTAIHDGSKWIPGNNEIVSVAQSTAYTEGDALADMIIQVERAIPGRYMLGTIADLKQLKFAQIDARTDCIFELGFEWEGARYSLTMEAQAKLLGFLVGRDVLYYPIRYNSIDDESFVDIPDKDVALQFVFHAMGTARAILDSGTDIKDSIRSATSVDEIDAANDPRGVALPDLKC